MNDPYKKAYERERLARLEAENLLEEKSRSLYKLNQELESKNAFLEKQQIALLRQEKLATIGMLSAGIAHEINNPLSFICSNLDILKHYWKAESEFFSAIQQALADTGLSENVKEMFNDLIHQHDIEYIHQDTTDLLSDTEEGLLRVRSIVQNLRSFSRSKSNDSEAADLNEGVTSTLKLLNSQITQNFITVKTNLNPINLVVCNFSEIKQVLLNLMVNAIHAMESSETKTLSISSEQLDATHIQIVISDTGSGIKEEDLANIFVPFFTTKEVGSGTGMGLSITQDILKDHDATIHVSSCIGKGTSFTLRFNSQATHD